MVDGKPYIIDAPDGVARRLVQAGIDLSSIAQIFVSHHHSDHNAGLGALLQLAWGAGLQTPVEVHGPAPLARLLQAHLDAADFDIMVRMKEEGRPDLRKLVSAREWRGGETILDDGKVRVRCAMGDHYTVPNLAFRFDTPDRSFVFSGDTAPSRNLVALARGGDVLVHEVMLESALDRITDANAPDLRDHLIKSHTTTEQLGRVAAEAGVKTVVLSHFVPAFPDITDEMWASGVRKHFSGKIVVGRDQMEL
jgi:ribonuclease BN (tRNA processing enzyme)